MRSARGGAVTIAAQVTKTAAAVLAMAVLGRLLSPDDFGLVAIALATVGVFGPVKDAGLFTATVQRATITDAQVSTLFWLNAAICSGVAVVIAAVAPGLGWFYGDPRIVWVVVALAGALLIDGLAVQHEAVMARQMRFTGLAAIDTASLTIGIAAALVLAVRGAGYWALVWQEVAYSLASAVLVWTVCRWRPGRAVRGSGVRPMVAFGLHLSGYKFLNYLALNLDTVFVGRFCGTRQAGIYDRSYRLLTAPLQLLQPLSDVAVPTLSRLQDEPERFRAFYRTGAQLVFAMSMPLMAFLFVDAERVVVTVLGSQWLAMVPVYRVLAPAAFLGKFGFLTSWVYVSTGRADRQLRWGAFALLPRVAAYAVGVRWGAMGVAAAYSIVACLLRYPSLVYCFKTAPVRVRDVIEAFWLPALASAGAGVLLFGLSGFLPAWSAPLALLADLILFTALYAAVWLAIPSGRRAVRDLLWLAGEAHNRRRSL